MSTERELPDLLPWDIAPPVVFTPEQILKHQAELIDQKSSRRLHGIMERSESEVLVTLGLTVDAPVLKYSVRVLTCTFEKDLPYPANVVAGNSGYVHRADDEETFREVIKKILDDSYSRSIFQSLLARIGEAMDKSNGKPGDPSIGQSQV